MQALLGRIFHVRALLSSLLRNRTHVHHYREEDSTDNMVDRQRGKSQGGVSIYSTHVGEEC